MTRPPPHDQAMVLVPMMATRSVRLVAVEPVPRRT